MSPGESFWANSLHCQKVITSNWNSNSGQLSQSATGINKNEKAPKKVSGGLGSVYVTVTVVPPDSLTVLKAQPFNWLQLQTLQHCLSWNRNQAIWQPCFKNHQPERLLTRGMLYAIHSIKYFTMAVGQSALTGINWNEKQTSSPDLVICFITLVIALVCCCFFFLMSPSFFKNIYSSQ